jgi:hypothetical protein
MIKRQARYIAPAVALGLSAIVSSSARADFAEQIINGGECWSFSGKAIPIPNEDYLAKGQILFDKTGEVNCSLRMSNELPVSKLLHVRYYVVVPKVSMSARLCVFPENGPYSCGPERQNPASSGMTVNSVIPPDPLPKGAQGAFVRFLFPAGADSYMVVHAIDPAWNK